VKFGPAMGLPEPSHQADAAAALIVTVFMMSVTVRLGKRAVDVLMDRAPAGVREQVEKVARAVEGVGPSQHPRAAVGEPPVHRPSRLRAAKHRA